ncbi:uncharacterized protein SAPINGB_P004905 [Magnusiomyces paraingens]|uniref:EF-hand domain-containing protein n=1 Tax=Magnusiomyces paraingens TaxID=2606893 RepID=A0A5E8C030_9ASCO|nr:uncharacterized protein SAPINGB_P004905 [Saprochaete ingens]VVT56230.1 unnamed protein product [Saprochaete ingens]
MKTFTLISLVGALASSLVAAHEAQEKRPDESWQAWHMREEHALDSFDSASFFTLHDLDGSGTWTPNDILNLYGLLNDKMVGAGDGMGEHKESKEIPQATKDLVLKTVLEMVDTDGDGVISQEEWRKFSEEDKKLLPDFGLGPGHHGDYEYEYEVHHWLKYHAKDDPDVKIVHKEDIEHENLYHAQEHQDHPDDHEHDKPQEQQQQQQQQQQEQQVVKPILFGAVNLKNVPNKYLHHRN